MCNIEDQWCVAVVHPIVSGEPVARCPTCGMPWNKAKGNTSKFYNDNAPNMVIVCGQCATTVLWRYGGVCMYNFPAVALAVPVPSVVNEFIAFTQATVREVTDEAYTLNRKEEIQAVRYELKLEALKKNARNN